MLRNSLETRGGCACVTQSAMNFIKALPGSTQLKIKPIRLHGIIAFLNTWIKRHMMHAQPPLSGNFV